MATIYGRRFHIRRGYLLVPQEMTAKNDRVYTVDLEYQVFDAETGEPISDTRTVQGEQHGNRLVIGDPHRDTRLWEYKIDAQPTSESKNYWQGFRAALDDRQWHREGQSKKHYGQTQAWWDGYNQGHREKKDPSAGYTPNAIVFKKDERLDEIDRLREASRARARSDEARRVVEQAHHDSWFGFTDTFSSSAKRRAVDVLGKQISVRGEFAARGDHVVRLVNAGWIVKEGRGGRELIGPDGGFFREGDLTKLGLDFAVYLQRQRALTPNARRITQQYNLQGVAGLVTRVKHPATRRTMSVYVAEQAGMDSDPDAPWLAVCEAHGTMVSCTTRAIARERLDYPDWCEECMEGES